ncbi:hypothetical protein [Deinococcus aestuarii]|uniref:hypothetical protein n=1 Tax=Deinococcus aestuarii TaxID=2774531 RepID=UPI001C0DE34D|nr:hypothetical protein [Deinococcus aestuarii]
MFRTVLLAAVALAATPFAHADDFMGSVVQDEYDNMLDEHTPPYREILSSTVGDLEDSGRATYRYTLVRGRTYRFFGVCDADCRDLDLVVYDANNTRVASDFAMNDRPTVDFTVPSNARSTSYTLAVIMASCENDPCQFALGHLRR